MSSRPVETFKYERDIAALQTSIELAKHTEILHNQAQENKINSETNRANIAELSILEKIYELNNDLYLINREKKEVK